MWDSDQEKERWAKSEAQSKQNFEMAAAGIFLVILSLFTSLIGWISDRASERREAQRQKEKEDYALKGKYEAEKLLRRTKGHPRQREEILDEFRLHARRNSTAWVDNFFGALPDNIQYYIDKEYQLHPDWFQQELRSHVYRASYRDSR